MSYQIPPLHWYAHTPGMVHAVSVHAPTLDEAKQKFRDWLGLTRLPPGTAVWQSDISRRH